MPYSPKPKTVLEKKQVEDMIAKAYETSINQHKSLELASLVSFLWLSGARISEALAVKREDVKADPRYLYVTITPLKRWAKTKDGTRKTTFPISLPLPRKKSIFTKLIIEQVKKIDSGERIWDFDRTNAWRKITALNPKIYLHTFRHTRATIFADRGVSDSKMKKWFGWSKMSGMAARYVDYSKLEMLEMTKVMEEK